MAKTSTVVLGASNLEITRDPAIGNATELIPKSHISGVYPIFNEKPSTGELTYENQSGPFQLGETITGGTSGATAVIQSFKGTTVMILEDVVGTFVDSEVITGGTSTETADVVGDSISTSYDGEWNYRFDNMTVLDIVLDDGRRVNIELQEVSNKATWNLGTLAALQTAVADILAWL